MFPPIQVFFKTIYAFDGFLNELLVKVPRHIVHVFIDKSKLCGYFNGVSEGKLGNIRIMLLVVFCIFLVIIPSLYSMVFNMVPTILLK